MPDESRFQKELAALLNSHSQENASNTPDFMLAQFLIACLKAWNETTIAREAWYGRAPVHIKPFEEE